MTKGVLVGLGVLLLSLCSIIIPIAHFVTVPGGPFFAGFVGIGHVKESTHSYGVQGLKFGSALGGVFLLVGGIVAGLVTAVVEPSQKVMVLVWGGVVIFTLYTASMASLGAMYSAMRADRKAEEGAQQSEAATV